MVPLFAASYSRAEIDHRSKEVVLRALLIEGSDAYSLPVGVPLCAPNFALRWSFGFLGLELSPGITIKLIGIVRGAKEICRLC